MTYQDFESQIVELITTELSDECTIDTKPVIKNNGITLHGLVINNGKCNISPTIYLDYYYKEFENGANIDKLAKQVIAQFFPSREGWHITSMGFSSAAIIPSPLLKILRNVFSIL